MEAGSLHTTLLGLFDHRHGCAELRKVDAPITITIHTAPTIIIRTKSIQVKFRDFFAWYTLSMVIRNVVLTKNLCFCFLYLR